MTSLSLQFPYPTHALGGPFIMIERKLQMVLGRFIERWVAFAGQIKGAGNNKGHFPFTILLVQNR